jgi:MraZ protein
MPTVAMPIPTVVTPPAITPTAAVTPVVTPPLRRDPGEPPLAPQPGPIQTYHVRRGGETMADIARHALGDAQRWEDIQKLNPALVPSATLPEGMQLRLPADACVAAEGVEALQPLPSLRPVTAPSKPRVVLPLTGTYVGNLDEKKTITLPKAIRDQLGSCGTVLVSPGPDHCLWLTNQAHLDRLAVRLEQSPANEADIRVFKRLYFAQTEKVAVSSEGRVQISERLAQFASLHQEVVMVGIDDHFELWDVGRWRAYTQQKSAAARAAMTEGE